MPFDVGLAWSVNRQARAPPRRGAAADTAATAALGVPAAALRLRRVDRADPGDAERRRVGAGQVHRLRRLVDPEPDPAVLDPAAASLVDAMLSRPWARRVAGRPARRRRAEAPRTRPAPARASSGGGRPQPARVRRGGTTSSPSSNSRVCWATSATPPGQPRELLGEDLGRRQRAVGAADLLAALVQRRARAEAASSGIGSTNSGYGANGAVRIATPGDLARVVAHDQPTTAADPAGAATPAASLVAAAARSRSRPRW